MIMLQENLENLIQGRVNDLVLVSVITGENVSVNIDFLISFVASVNRPIEI